MRACVCVFEQIVFKHRQLLLNRPIRTFKWCSTPVMVKANVWNEPKVVQMSQCNCIPAHERHTCYGASDSGGICEILENLICFFAWS